MITSHATFVLLAERRAHDRPAARMSIEPRRSTIRARLSQAVLAAVHGFRRNVSSTDVDPAPGHSS